MIIPVRIMGKMQMPVQEEICMIAVRHGFVAAIRAVDV